MRELFRLVLEICREVFEVVPIPRKFFEVFGLAWTCSDAFGPIRMQPDVF